MGSSVKRKRVKAECKSNDSYYGWMVQYKIIFKYTKLLKSKHYVPGEKFINSVHLFIIENVKPAAIFLARPLWLRAKHHTSGL